ncbi:P-loop containing nucleoside triphosphate hydrolase protein [Lentinus tigrinus ALCF2SS1-7]|uniref:P-loop containing nucleoside triphosphate hydrolase protein n=1 Tax=Lentinus tigrinus ALCF2SS1-6 TaxID=1328759 RepID=A0A5C2RUR0_9APHY|nr:P-loop containing nucleoside triphosphate hydrolase protein [Lentinus tigrinus ALCF2SS1-6]RPD71336.1 P-loop containing nucleoside triphosphate hydrolase protein [Lentinus tigrinus ALCF2SS1-7]
MASEPTLSTLAALAASSSGVDDEAYTADPTSSRGAPKTKEQLRRHYIRALHKVIDESDIIILVLDARDPEGCRSRLVEEEVRRREGEGKRLVFVLNKVDLVSRDNAEAWLRYLRHSTPTLPFKSAGSHQRSNLSSSTAPALLRLLKAYKPSVQSITVGIVGYPNVGKSSLINSLKRSKVCAVAAQPGHTKELQTIQLERGLKIIDSPGVVFDDDAFDDGKSQRKSNVLLRNVVKVEDIEDPVAIVEEIIARTDHAVLKKLYNVEDYASPLEFLTMVALTTGRLLKGGTPDILAAARQILTDWNHQKIPYFSSPPELHPSLVPSTVPGGSNQVAPGAETVGQAQIVTEFAKPFTLDGLFGAADAGAFGAGADTEMADAVGDMEGEAESMDEDGKQMESDDLAPHIPRKRSRSPSVASFSTVTDASHATPAQAQTNDTARPPAPKRLRRSHDVPDYHAPVDEHARRAMASANPLGRRVLKREAKKARRAANRAALQHAARGMEVDDDAGLEATFMS